MPCEGFGVKEGASARSERASSDKAPQPDFDALTELLPAVYEDLRQLAANCLRGERPEHTLQPTALVHEAYLRLIDQRPVNWKDRAHLLGFGARLMRQILINHANARTAQKRGGTDARARRR